MNWEYLRTFLIIAEHESFSIAAEYLNTTQATVSRRMQELEKRIGRRLLTRTKKGSVPTSVGKKLVPCLKEMNYQFKQIEDLINYHDGEKQKIIISCAEMTSVLLSQKMHLIYNGVENVEIVITSTNKFLDIAKGEADIAIRNRKPTNDELLFQELNRGKYNTYSVYGNAQTFKEGDRLFKKDFSNYDWVVFSKSKAMIAVNWIQKHVTKKSIKYQVHNASLVMAVVSSTPGTVALLPRFIGSALNNVVELYGPIEDLSFKHYIVRRNERNDQAKKIVNNLKDLFLNRLK